MYPRPRSTRSPEPRTGLAAAPDTPALRPTALEIASCTVSGRIRAVAAYDRQTMTPLAALEQAILPALQRAPCVVSFSGGMDSSFVLAVAVRAARRHGLPLPVPVTWRFSGAPRAEESAWQEQVIAALPELDWHRLHADDDLDLIGPVAQQVLTRHGVLLPPNVHLHLPIIELASGGSLLTGAGGDQMLSGRKRSGRGARIRRHAPGPLVAALRRGQGRDPFPWLRPAASRAVFSTQRRELRGEPSTIDRRIRWRSERRDLLMSCASLDALAADLGVHVVNPLLDNAFLAALSELRHGRSELTRSAQLVGIAEGQLPGAVTAARPKARFLEVFLRTPTRRFVQSWDGRGADDSVVDTVALRELWSAWPIPAGTAGLVQQLWLSSAARG